MARYLTPAKIGLLALIEVYVEGAVPNEGILPVLSFISSRVLNYDADPSSPPFSPPQIPAAESVSAARWKRAEDTIRLLTSIKDFEKLLQPFPAADRVPGRRLWNRFLEKLWLIDSLHALQEFFDRRLDRLAKTKEELRRMEAAGETLPPWFDQNSNNNNNNNSGSGGSGSGSGSGIVLSRNSPFGIFIRRSHLEFARLQFHHATELWRHFVLYRKPTGAHWRRLNSRVATATEDPFDFGWGGNDEELEAVARDEMLLSGGAGHELGDPAAGEMPVSMDDLEGLMETQIELSQKFGDRVPVNIKEKFQMLAQGSHIIPSLSHYLKFSDNWRAGDYPMAFEFLHRYFDYTMSNRDRLFYHYALMNLAVVQSDFGCHREAVVTMLETIATARENRDMTCLNYALNWLHHFSRAHPELMHELESGSMLGSTGREALSFLRSKAHETGNWALWSSALLSEAKLAMTNGESVATVLESIVRSSQIIVEHNTKTMLGAQMSMQIALWDRLGLSALSTMTCEVFLRCHARLHAQFDDELKVTCRLAGLLAGRGRYDDAFAALERLQDADHANSLRSVKPAGYWRQYRGLLKLRRDLHRGNLDGAETLLAQLLQASRPEDGLEPDMVFVVDSMHIEALARRGDLDAALAKVDRLAAELLQTNNPAASATSNRNSTCRDGDTSGGQAAAAFSIADGRRDISLRIRLLLTKANLLQVCGRPQRGFGLAVRAASLAFRARLIPLLWQASAALAAILTSLGEFAASAELLEAVLPRALELDSAFVAGTMWSLLADARMGMAGEAGVSQEEGAGEGGGEEDGRTHTPPQREQAGANTADPPSATPSAGPSLSPHGKRRTELLTRAQGALERAFACFSAVEDADRMAEMMAKKAAAARAAGDDALAEDYAARYLVVKAEADLRNAQ